MTKRARRPTAPTPADTRTLRREARTLRSENRALRRNLSLVDEMRLRLGSLTERMAMVSQISQELNILDLEALAKTAVEKISALIGARYSSLFLYDSGHDELVLKEHNYPHTEARQVVIREYQNTLMGQALMQKRTVHIANMAEYEKSAEHRYVRTFADRFARRTFLSVPLIAGGFVMGIINFADKNDGTGFNDVDDLPVIEQLRPVLAIALHNSRLFLDTQNQARTDTLTQLLTVRIFHESLEAEIHRAVRYSRPLSLLMIDLDHFKKINDTYGHTAGDEVLKRVGSVIRGCIRKGDIAARYGGDEFSILLPETAPAGALCLANRLIGQVRAQQVPVADPPLSITVSIGIASHVPSLSATEFLQRADKALYAAKQKGRDGYDVMPAERHTQRRTPQAT